MTGSSAQSRRSSSASPMIADKPLLASSHPGSARAEFKIIAVSSIASAFRGFVFFLYGSLGVIISRNFFSNVNETSAFVLALLTFAAGFAVRPFGAIVFGFIGDLWGRKNTFLITLGLMGGATFAVGLLPTYRQIGAAAPWILVILRMLQGLSVGGVYGGAAVYVASTYHNGAADFSPAGFRSPRRSEWRSV